MRTIDVMYHINILHIANSRIRAKMPLTIEAGSPWGDLTRVATAGMGRALQIWLPRYQYLT